MRETQAPRRLARDLLEEAGREVQLQLAEPAEAEAWPTWEQQKGWQEQVAMQQQQDLEHVQVTAV
jgi:hypothetical protein